MTTLAGDSNEQQKAERWLISALSKKKKLEVELAKKKWSLEGGSYIELDGYCESPKILCEAWAHIGSLKTAQKNKVMTDAFKLIFVNKLVKGNYELILLFADTKAAESKELKDEILNAQKRQYR